MGVFARLFYLLVLAKKILDEDLYRDRTARRRGLAQLRIFILIVGTERSGGVPGRIRTSDPLLRRQPLCPLSYWDACGQPNAGSRISTGYKYLTNGLRWVSRQPYRPLGL